MTTVIKYRVDASATKRATTPLPVAWNAWAVIEQRDNQGLDLDWDADIDGTAFTYEGHGETLQQAFSHAKRQLQAHMSQPNMFGHDAIYKRIAPLTTRIGTIIDDTKTDPCIVAAVASAVAYAEQENAADLCE